jgi:hypothetical protein
MKKLLQESVEFYSMLEYFTTRNEDDSNGLPTIPSKPFDENSNPNNQFIGVLNNRFFGNTKINCVLLKKDTNNV